MFIALGRLIVFRAPAERNVLCLFTLHAAPDGAEVDQDREAIDMLLLRSKTSALFKMTFGQSRLNSER